MYTRTSMSLFIELVNEISIAPVSSLKIKDDSIASRYLHRSIPALRPYGKSLSRLSSIGD
jgi:hypothetical protein